MGALSIYLRNVAGGGLTFWCPSCKEVHTVWHGEGPGPRWGWNGDVINPTFTPSILVNFARRLTEEEHARVMAGEDLSATVRMVCHSFVTDGRIQYLGDCTHELAGQTVSLVPMPKHIEAAAWTWST